MEEIARFSPSILRHAAVFAARLSPSIRVNQAMLLAVMLPFFLCSLGNAQTTQTIYANTFSGGATGLNNEAPTVATDYAGGAGTAIWRDVANTKTFYANGMLGSGAKDSLVLPFTPENGYVYTLTASVTFTGDPGSWMGVGFAQNYVFANSGYTRFTDNGTGTNTGPGGYDWAVLTESSGSAEYLAGPKTTGTILANQANFVTPGPGTHTFVLTLDTTGVQWAISCSIDGKQAGSSTYTTPPPIGAVGITQNGLTSPGVVQWNSFKLEATGTRSTNAVSAAVDFANTGVPLNPSFVGLSYEKAELTTSLFTSANTPLISLFRLLGPGVLRIGGGTVDTTLWNGVSNTTPITPSEVDSFTGFVKKLPGNWSVIYGVNLKTNTPANAAAEAAYAANDIKHWLLGFELGNEPEAYWTYSTFLPNWDGEESAITSTVPGWDHGTGRHGWIIDGTDAGDGVLSSYLDTFASDESGVASLLTLHYYVGSSTGATMQRMLQQPDTTLESAVTNIVGAATGNQSLGTRITECGSYANGGTLGVSNAFGAALWALDFMFTVAENGGQGVNFHGGDKSPYSPINNNGTTITSVGPEYYAMKMFSLVPQGGSIVPATVTLNTNANFTAYGVLGTNGAVSAVLNNKEVNDTVSVSINLGSGVSRVGLITLTAPNLFDSTGFTIGGATITTDGKWKGGVQAVLAATNGQLTVDLPPATAYLLIPQK